MIPDKLTERPTLHVFLGAFIGRITLKRTDILMNGHEWASLPRLHLAKFSHFGSPGKSNYVDGRFRSICLLQQF
jgi:hypothetical protein